MAKTKSKTRAGKGSAGGRKSGVKSEPQPQPQRELRGDELDRVSGGVPENTIGGAHRT